MFLGMIFSLEMLVFVSLSALTWFSALRHNVDFSRPTSLRVIGAHVRSKHVRHNSK